MQPSLLLLLFMLQTLKFGQNQSVDVVDVVAVVLFLLFDIDVDYC